MRTWKAETPGRVPAGARISAGKSGRVDRSLPTSAEVLVNWVPVSCMPSPESPAKRMTTSSIFSGAAVCLSFSAIMVFSLPIETKKTRPSCQVLSGAGPPRTSVRRTRCAPPGFPHRRSNLSRGGRSWYSCPGLFDEADRLVRGISGRDHSPQGAIEGREPSPMAKSDPHQVRVGYLTVPCQVPKIDEARRDQRPVVSKEDVIRQTDDPDQ